MRLKGSKTFFRPRVTAEIDEAVIGQVWQSRAKTETSVNDTVNRLIRKGLDAEKVERETGVSIGDERLLRAV